MGTISILISSSCVESGAQIVRNALLPTRAAHGGAARVESPFSLHGCSPLLPCHGKHNGPILCYTFTTHPKCALTAPIGDKGFHYKP